MPQFVKLSTPEGESFNLPPLLVPDENQDPPLTLITSSNIPRLGSVPRRRAGSNRLFIFSALGRPVGVEIRLRG
jgi:hypothetical protein